MTRFKNIVYIVLILPLLLNYTPIANSQEVISEGFGRKVIPVTYGAVKHVLPLPDILGRGVTWQRRIPTEGGSVALDLEISSTGTVVAGVSGEIHFYAPTRTIKVNNLKGNLGYTSDVTLKGDVVLDFTIPLPEAFFGEDRDVHINHREWVPEFFKGKVEGANNFPWRVFSSATQVWGRGLGSGTIKTQAYPSPQGGIRLDLVPYVANAIGFPTPAEAAKRIFKADLSDYLKAHFDLYGSHILGELTLTSKAITVNGVPITRINHPIPAPGFDPTQGTYRIESNYDEEIFTYKLDGSFHTRTSAAVTVLGDIEIWRYEHAAKTDTPLIRESILDLDFEGVDTSITMEVPPKRPVIEPIRGVVPDQVLAGAIWNHLDLQRNYLEVLKTDPEAKPRITREDMLRLRDLGASGGVRSLTGLEHAVNLVELDLSYNVISEVSLSDMPNLKELNLSENPLSKISLSDMPNLIDIRFFDNAISEMSLSGVTNLGAEGGRSSAGSWGVSYPIHSTTVSKLSLSGPTEVTRLNLSSSAISEVSLSEMPNLTEVTLANNAISDISAWDWQNLPNLEKLDLSYNALSGPSFPFWLRSRLSSLRELDLSHNALSGLFSWGLTPSLLNLEKLDLSYNTISDVAGGVIPGRLTELDLSYNVLSRIPSLAGRSLLTRLNLRFNAISEVSGVAGLQNLRELWLSDNAISDISSLSELPNLTQLYLHHNAVSDVSNLSEFTNLTQLYLSGNNISDVSSLSGLPNLTQLYLDDNAISEVSLSEMPNLTKLSLSYNPISKLVLSGLPSLTELALSNPYVSVQGVYIPEVDPLEVSLSGLSDFTELDLSRRAVSEVSLSDIPNLTRLNLSENTISDVSGLSELPNLTILHLQNNNISDISPLAELPNLTELWLYDNPLSHTSRSVHIPAMQRRGVQVYFSWVTYPRLVKVSGEDQVGLPGTQLLTPFVVQAINMEGKPIPKVPIQFAVAQGRGQLSTTTATTDANGKAQTTLTLGPNPGTNTVAVIAGADETQLIAKGGVDPGPHTDPVVFEKAVSFSATASGDVPPVQVTADVNGDGVVNIQDLTIVASNLGKTGEHVADVNGDGIVNIQDLVKVSEALQ